MAFDTNNGSGRNGNSGNNNARENNEAWKAHGFINLYVKNKGGTRSKLGVIVLKEANVREHELSKWLAGDDENKTNLALLANRIQFEYNPADTGDASHFDLPFEQAPAEAE